MAPEDTSTTWVPPLARAASASTSAVIRCWSIPPSAVVSDDDPTLTTTRSAVAMSARFAVAMSARFAVASRSTPVTPAPAPAQSFLRDH